MLEFDSKVFNELLQTVPMAIPYCEKPQHSDYLQTEVFDRLGRGESIDLSKLDLNALSSAIRLWRGQEIIMKAWHEAGERASIRCSSSFMQRRGRNTLFSEGRLCTTTIMNMTYSAS